ncbi:hypothetical protein BJI67_16235 (plasmid) [Acidihalobacter aeolianus]|uniref:Conjugal transfer protein TraB n=1 Tax=Acidihalobacter aeolianus TaxID=2792603 RepID=A0A1D8KCU8_9GAMM|nr:TraB/VirB10 family protein [Acidihalobacter aeolianus]AOV18787.1 hypothetical protein BJI67_16235 [Acidihalobacter aeolianus]
MSEKPKITKPKNPESAGSFLRSSKGRMAVFAGAGVVLLILIARMMGGGQSHYRPPPPKPINTTPGTNNLYDRTLSDRVQSLSSQNQQLQSQLDTLTTKLQNLQQTQVRMAHEEKSALSKQAGELSAAQREAEQRGKHTPTPPNSKAPGSGFNPSSYKMPPQPNGGYVPPPPPAGGYSGNAPESSSGNASVSSGPAPLEIANANAPAKAKTLKVKWKKNPYAGYMPAGSFAKAALLTGVDAGTSDYTRSNPQPILMRVQSNAQLPGAARYGIKACFLIGSGYGNLSAERVYIRLTHISCISQSLGGVVASPIQGYVVDSDGVLGMRGRVINRTGALLAKALLAGFAQGASSIARMASESVTTSSLTGATTATISPNNILKGAGFAGIGGAASILARQYIKEASSIYPVIEVPPGRKATVVLTKGVSLKWSLYTGLYHPVVNAPHDGTIPAAGNDTTGATTSGTQQASSTLSPVTSTSGAHS